MLHFFWLGCELREYSYSRYEVANFEIPKWAEYYLGKQGAVHQSHCRAGRVTENPGDILIGHPTWDDSYQMPLLEKQMGRLVRDWVKDNALHPNDPCHPNTYILMPWLAEFPPEWTKSMPHHVSQFHAARKIFALCGEFWMQKTLEKTDDSIQAQVKDKLVHCNIGVAAQSFTQLKRHFNPIGARRLLHISDLKHHKGFDITCESVEGLDTVLGVGSVHLQAPAGMVELEVNGKPYRFEFAGPVNNRDPGFNQWIVDTFDFYIHTARLDACASTILENSARGLVPLVTPESGFASPHAIYLTHNPDENRKVIESALNLPEEELLKRSQLNREYVIREHNWETIYGKIWDELAADVQSRQVSA